MGSETWDVWADTGGTFTDCLARDPEGHVLRCKVLSSSALRGTVSAVIDSRVLEVEQSWGAPDDFVRGCAFHLLGCENGVRIERFDAESSTLYLERDLGQPVRPETPFEVRSPEEAPVLAARLITGTPHGEPLPRLRLRLATTRGTNALLEGKGTPPILFITRGFADLLEIGTQARPDLFALDIEKPQPLHGLVVEVAERLAADGSVIEPLDLEELRPRCRKLLASGQSVAAVALMHAYRNDAHERELEAFLEEEGFEHVSVSSALAPSIRLLPRARTAVVNAYLAPVISTYLSNVRGQIGADSLAGFHIMTSAGGLAGPGSFSPKDSLLSGPAGGVVGASTSGSRSRVGNLIAFDMGGTSTDVSRRGEDFAYVFEHRVGDAELLAPALAIETVAAGGGSVCWYDGARLRVGPHSAGARPGPACYGAGGPLSLTDVNLLLGRLDASGFEIPVFPEKARERLSEIRKAMTDGQVSAPGKGELLEGFLAIANERMADAIRRVSVREGYDPGDYALVSFGGAGGQHACAIAGLLGMRRILVPSDASLLSAFGLGHAVIERFAEETVLRPFDEAERELAGIVDRLSQAAIAQVESEGLGREDIVVRQRFLNLRLVGQDSSLPVVLEPGKDPRDSFLARYADTFGYQPEHKPIELETVRVVASSRPVDVSVPESANRGRLEAIPVRSCRACFCSEWLNVPVFEWGNLQAGSSGAGPCLVFDRHTSVTVEPGWTFESDAAGNLVMERSVS